MTAASEDMRSKRLRIVDTRIDHVEDSREYEWPDGWDSKQVNDLLVERKFLEVREPRSTMEFRVEVTDETWVNESGMTMHKTLEYHCYQFPDGWGIEDVRDMLRPIGFPRIDNRQDSPDEPNPFN